MRHGRMDQNAWAFLAQVCNPPLLGSGVVQTVQMRADIPKGVVGLVRFAGAGLILSGVREQGGVSHTSIHSIPYSSAP